MLRHLDGHPRDLFPGLVARLLAAVPACVVVTLPSSKSALTELVDNCSKTTRMLIAARSIGVAWSSISQPFAGLDAWIHAPDTFQLQLAVVKNDYMTLGDPMEMNERISLGAGTYLASRRVNHSLGGKLQQVWPGIALMRFMEALVETLEQRNTKTEHAIGPLRRALPQLMDGRWFGGSEFRSPLPLWVQSRNELVLSGDLRAYHEEDQLLGTKPPTRCFRDWLERHRMEQQEESLAPVVIKNRRLVEHLQAILDPNMIVIAETGDAWFITQKLLLPLGCSYVMQMQFGSIGWSVGAILGIALATQRRVLSVIGDGSLQIAAQEIGTMLRYRLNPILLVINNGGYMIEVM